MLCSRLLFLLLNVVLLVHGQLSVFEAPYEDDFVDVQFKDCKSCEHNFRNMVFLLKRSDEREKATISVYSIVVLLMWLCLGVLVVLQRWRKQIIGAYRAQD